jgi:sulfatase maturation enzyme AslB (radical SAM superfamily)
MFNQKVLCIGNNTEDTDKRTTLLAQQNKAPNNGIINSIEFIPVVSGYYHTSILDLSFGEIVAISKHFDLIVFLDQPKETWSHWKPLLSTYKIMLELEKLGLNVVYKENKNVKNYLEFFNSIDNNKSFCIYPWIEITEERGYLLTCARGLDHVTKFDELKDWRTDPHFGAIRNKMLKGERLENNCKVCYEHEDKKIESYRQFETKEWLAKLDISSFEDLEKITHPHYYEIRLSNKCNIMCRGCKPEHSHLIDREFKKFNIKFPQEQTFQYSKLDRINIETLNSKVRVYLTGGEPTVIPEVYEFMEKCIAAGKTDFDFTLGINAAKISTRFLELANNFQNLNFSVSLDGFGLVNDYWRWGTSWDKVIKNTKLLQSHGHTISINCVPGIYNVTNLHLLYEFLDKEFPHTGIYLQINRVGFQSAYNHPNSDMVVESMARCKQTKTYYTDGKSNKTAIDSLYDYYSSKPECDLQSLKEFFEYNDKLDAARNSRLGDYIPELEACRKYIGGIV